MVGVRRFFAGFFLWAFVGGVCLEAVPSVRTVSKYSLLGGFLGLLGVTAYRKSLARKAIETDHEASAKALRRAVIMQRLSAAIAAAGGLGMLLNQEGCEKADSSSVIEGFSRGGSSAVSSVSEVLPAGQQPQKAQAGADVAAEHASVPLPQGAQVVPFQTIDPWLRDGGDGAALVRRIENVRAILKNSRLSPDQKYAATRLQIPVLLAGHRLAEGEVKGAVTLFYELFAPRLAGDAVLGAKEAEIKTLADGVVVRMVVPALQDPLEALPLLVGPEIDAVIEQLSQEIAVSGGKPPVEEEMLEWARRLGRLTVAYEKGLLEGKAKDSYFELYKDFHVRMKWFFDTACGPDRPFPADELLALQEGLEQRVLPRAVQSNIEQILKDDSLFNDLSGRLCDKLEDVLRLFARGVHTRLVTDYTLCRQLLDRIDGRFPSWAEHSLMRRLYERPFHYWTGGVSVWENGILGELVSYFPRGTFQHLPTDGSRLERYWKR